MSRRRPDARTWARLDCRRISPRGVIVPHRNRTRGLGGLLCAFYNGRDARCASCGRDARHPDNGLDDWGASFAAKMAAFPVRPRQARPLPQRARCPLSQSAVAGRPPYRWAFSLHGGSDLPTRRIASPYTEGLGFLHGEAALSTRPVWSRAIHLAIFR